jgi:uncharacterized protein (DUF1330 family)
MSAYFVLHNRIIDDDAMQNSYIPMAVGSLMAHGAEILAIADESTVVEGAPEFPRTILIRFDTREQAEAWYNSPEYQQAIPIRQAATEGFCVLVDGFVMPG